MSDHQNNYSHPATDEEDNRPHDDHCWALGSEEVRSQFGGRVVAVHRRVVWGSGGNDFDALADAQTKPGCPHRLALTFVSVPQENAGSFWEEYFSLPGGGFAPPPPGPQQERTGA